MTEYLQVTIHTILRCLQGFWYHDEEKRTMNTSCMITILYFVENLKSEYTHKWNSDVLDYHAGWIAHSAITIACQWRMWTLLMRERARREGTEIFWVAYLSKYFRLSLFTHWSYLQYLYIYIYDIYNYIYKVYFSFIINLLMFIPTCQGNSSCFYRDSTQHHLKEIILITFTLPGSCSIPSMCEKLWFTSSEQDMLCKIHNEASAALSVSTTNTLLWAVRCLRGQLGGQLWQAIHLGPRLYEVHRVLPLVLWLLTHALDTHC